MCLEVGGYENWEVGNGLEKSPLLLTISHYWKPLIYNAMLSDHMAYCQWSYVLPAHFRESKILAVQVHDNNHKHFPKSKLCDICDMDCQVSYEF